MRQKYQPLQEMELPRNGSRNLTTKGADHSVDKPQNVAMTYLLYTEASANPKAAKCMYIWYIIHEYMQSDCRRLLTSLRHGGGRHGERSPKPR